VPVHYDISPSLNLVVYICTEAISTVQFFETGDQVTLDSRLKPNTNVIIDFYLAELELSVADLRFAIEKMKETKQRGQEVRTAVLTKSTSLKFLGDALKLMSAESPFDFNIFNTEKDAIRWLKLSEEEEALQFWVETRKNALKQHPSEIAAYPFSKK
jgi:hypothetical protein